MAAESNPAKEATRTREGGSSEGEKEEEEGFVVGRLMGEDGGEEVGKVGGEGDGESEDSSLQGESYQRDACDEVEEEEDDDDDDDDNKEEDGALVADLTPPLRGIVDAISTVRRGVDFKVECVEFGGLDRLLDAVVGKCFQGSLSPVTDSLPLAGG